LHLLIVDDDATQRALISAAAGHAGHVITLAQSCSEAIEKIQATRFDCVTLRCSKTATASSPARADRP
jgi:two-component system, chemotaxis family, chemotaxis protein CheY